MSSILHQPIIRPRKSSLIDPTTSREPKPKKHISFKEECIKIAPEETKNQSSKIFLSLRQT